VFAGLSAKLLGSIATVVVGGVIATVTVFGLVSSQVNSAADNAANANRPSIDYGSNG
jgi:hypothetical protein